MSNNLTAWLSAINAPERAQHLVVFAKEHIRNSSGVKTLGSFLNCLNDNELTTLNFLLELDCARKDIEELITYTHDNVFFCQEATMEDTISYFKLIASLITRSRQLGGDYVIKDETVITFKPEGATQDTEHYFL
jgi:hypothetical protein